MTTTNTDTAMAALEPLATEKWVQNLHTQWKKPDTNAKQFHTKLRVKLGEKRKSTKQTKHATAIDAALAALQPASPTKPPTAIPATTPHAKQHQQTDHNLIHCLPHISLV